MIKKTPSVCPYCGTGCRLNLLTNEENKVVGVEPLDGVNNGGDLCLKGYYGYDFINDTKILTPRIYSPMIRREKGAPFERVSWDEAIKFATDKLKAIKEKHGPDAIMATGSSRSAGNEANYAMMKFIRGVIGTNNIDNCASV